VPLDFVGYVEAQTGQLKKLAAFAQEHGYWIWFHAGREEALPSMLKRHTVNALAAMLHTHAEEMGRRTPLNITVMLDTPQLAASRDAGKLVLDDIEGKRIAVRFNLPNRVKFKPIVGALSLISEEHDRLVRPGMMLFTHHKMSERHEYYGRGKGALSALVSILNMPENRALLKG